MEQLPAPGRPEGSSRRPWFTPSVMHAPLVLEPFHVLVFLFAGPAAERWEMVGLVTSLTASSWYARSMSGRR